MNVRSLRLFDKLTGLLYILQNLKTHTLKAENSTEVCTFDNTGNWSESDKNETIIGKDGITFYHKASYQTDVLNVQWILVSEDRENLNSPCPDSKAISNHVDRNNDSVIYTECKVGFRDMIAFLTTSLKVLLYGDNGNNTFLICKSRAFIFSGQWNISQDLRTFEYHCILNLPPTNETFIAWTMRAQNNSFTENLPCCSSEDSNQKTVFTYNACNARDFVCKIKLNDTAMESMNIFGDTFLRCSDLFEESIGSNYIKIEDLVIKNNISDGQGVLVQPSGYQDILIPGISLGSVIVLLMVISVILTLYGCTLPAVTSADNTSDMRVAEFDVYDVIEQNTE